MPTIEELVERIRQTPDCSVEPPAGLPTVVPGTDHRLPDDVARLYALTGGAWLFRHSMYGFRIPEPDGVIQVDMARLGKVYTTDISASWYIIARSTQLGLDEISIDLAPERLGRCYESFFDSHRSKGNCPIVATSFSDLLQRLLDAGGRDVYWLEDDFESLGDAYDGYEARWVQEERATEIR